MAQTAFAFPPLVAIPPVVSVSHAVTAGTATVTLNLTDKQGRVESVEFQTQVGAGAPSAWTPDASVPYSASAAVNPTELTIIRWRVIGFDLNSAPNQILLAGEEHFIDAAGSFLPLSGGTLTGFLTLHADPTAALHAATKQYVDQIAAGLDVKGSVRAASTANLTLSGPQSIDGVSVIAGDRVLVKNQTAPEENGIYVVAAGAWTRATDADAWAELPGAFGFVEEGTAHADTGWVCTVDAGGTLGTTPITWTQFTGVLPAHTHPATDISDSTVAGRALLTAADAAAQRAALNVTEYTIPIPIGDGVSVIPTGIWIDVEVRIAGVISSVTLLGNESGSIVLDLWKCTYAQFDNATHPVVGDSIVASAPPTIASAHKSQDTTLTGWTKVLAVGDVLRVYVNSVTNLKRVLLSIAVARS